MKNMTKTSLALITSLLVTSNIYAADNGQPKEITPNPSKSVYLISQAGLGIAEAYNFFSTVEVNTNSAFYGRIGAGYNFTPLLSIELGLSLYPKTTRKTSDDLLSDYAKETSEINSVYGGDIIGMLNLPLGSYWSASFGAGVAITHFHYTPLKSTDFVGGWGEGSAVLIAPKLNLRATSKITDRINAIFSTSFILSSGGFEAAAKQRYHPGFATFSAGLSVRL